MGCDCEKLEQENKELKEIIDAMRSAMNLQPMVWSESISYRSGR